MSWNAFADTILLLILVAFIVERSLAVVFETRLYITKYGTSKVMKPSIAIIYAMVFVTVLDINIVDVMRQTPDTTSAPFNYAWTGGIQQIAYNLLVIALTGIFIAGGSKASLKLFRDVLNIKSTDEAMRTAEIKPVPAKPIQAAAAAAGGNTEAEIMLYNMFDAHQLPKATWNR